MARFDSLSDEILLYLRSTISVDLLTHISLSQTCRRLRKLYVDDDAFWQFACFGAGFGRPLRRGGLEFGNILTWRRLAHVLVNHASHCQIRSCRDANVDFAEHYRLSMRTGVRSPLPVQPDILLHPLYFYLHFSHLPTEGASFHDTTPDVLSILLTHLPTFPESKSSQYGPLCSHPNASCAFATFPPMESLSFQDTWGNTFLAVNNPDGCTILDVNRALAALIPQELAAVETALSHYDDLIRTSGLSKHQFADMVSKERGFLGDHEYASLRVLVVAQVTLTSEDRYPFLQELVAQAC